MAFVEKGKVARMASVRALTEEAGRLSYLLANVPAETTDLEAALAKALPGAKFTWQTAGEERRTLVCTYEAAAGTVATVNRTVLPVLLTHTDVLSVETGLSLEQAYLTNQTKSSS